MKKRLQPFGDYHIFINTNGATFTDSPYSINMWTTLPYLLKFQQNPLVKTLLFMDSALVLKSCTLPTFFSTDLCPSWNQIETQNHVNGISFSKNQLPSPKLFSSLKPKQSEIFHFKTKHIARLNSKGFGNSNFLDNSNNSNYSNNSIAKKHENVISAIANKDKHHFDRVYRGLDLLGFFLYKILIHSKESNLSFWKTYSEDFLRIKTLDTDIYTNPLKIWTPKTSISSSSTDGTNTSSPNFLLKFKKHSKRISPPK
jgi:hypothetical protein